MIEIYTDGSCIKDNKGGFGVIVLQNGEVIDSHKERHENTTNNQMEMKAIIWALKYVEHNNIKDKVIIYSDSQYAISSFRDWAPNWERNGWTRSGGAPVLNLDLVKIGYYSLMELGNVNFQKVKGHSGNEFNEYADMLATDAPCKNSCIANGGCKYYNNKDKCVLGFESITTRVFKEVYKRITEEI